jgi:MscS family membrane protein
MLLWGVSDLQLTIKPSLFLYYCAKGMISLSVVMLSLRLIDVFGRILEEKAAETEGRMDDQLVPVAIRVAKLFAALVGLIFVLQNIGVNVSALIASLGVGGIAIALAAKDTLANVFGSITIFTDRPFQVGDVVSIDGVVGSVEDVGLRSTRIRTPSNSLLSIPNATVANSKIDNLGARDFRRTKVILGLTYGTSTKDINAFVEGVRAILEATEEVKKDNYEVHFVEFGPSSLDIITSFYLKVEGWHHEMVVRSKINMEIIRLSEKLGVDFAFPSQSIYVESVPKKA